jgi:hypothetical protein
MEGEGKVKRRPVAPQVSASGSLGALNASKPNLTKFQKGVYYSGIKIFDNLPHEIKDLPNEITLFRNALKRFLLINSFYNSEEYFN